MQYSILVEWERERQFAQIQAQPVTNVPRPPGRGGHHP